MSRGIRILSRKQDSEADDDTTSQPVENNARAPHKPRNEVEVRAGGKKKALLPVSELATTENATASDPAGSRDCRK